MENIILYKLIFADFIKRIFLLFIKFYLMFFLLVLVINGLDIFSIILPFVVVLTFFVTNKILIDFKIISNNDDEKKLQLTFYKFLIIKTTIESPINKVTYSFREEFTSRLTRGDVFKIYFDNEEVYKRHHQLDGLTEDDVFYIIDELKKIGITEV